MQRLHRLAFLVYVFGKQQSIGALLTDERNGIVCACFLWVIVINLFSCGCGRVCKANFFSIGVKQME